MLGRRKQRQKPPAAVPDKDKMYNEDTEILFPSRVIPALRGMHGPDFDDLIDQVNTKGPDSIEHISFVYMMVKLGGCATCNADSFRALKGCTQCAKQTIKRFRGNDSELIKSYDEAVHDVEAYFSTS